MALSKLGAFIELTEERNSNLRFGISDVKGISIKKVFIPTKADMDGVPLTSYKVVKPEEFCYVTITSRNGEKITIALNDSNETYICSSSYIAFRIKDTTKLLPYYLYMFFNRPEFDRYTRFNSWGSAREAFSWEDMCDIEIDIPPIEVQQKVVDVYLAMVANQKAYERGLDDLKLACEAYIEDLKKHTSLVELNVFIEEVTAQNSDATYKIDDVMGVSKNKEIIPTKANASENDLTKFIVIEKNDFVYNPRSANAIAINSKLPGCIISWNNTAFRVKKDYNNVLLSKYLNLWFSRAEYSRWAKYNSWGSSTELLSLDEIKKYHIPLPNMKIQEAIVKVFENYESRKFINDKLKTLINHLCPLLIKGSISFLSPVDNN